VSITFAVDDVEAVRDSLATVPLAAAVEETLGVGLHCVSHSAELIS
jgi:hypothetical protein